MGGKEGCFSNGSKDTHYVRSHMDGLVVSRDL